MNDSDEPSYASLAAKLGLTVVGAALMPGAGAMGVGIATIIGGLVGESAFGFLGDATSKLRAKSRPLGEPNHDLNKALARAIEKACRDLEGQSAEKRFREALKDLEVNGEGAEAKTATAFFRALRKDPEGALVVAAENPDLKRFLENPSEDALNPLLQSLGAESFPGAPPELREWLIKNLHGAIAARFWDEIKNTDAAWRAYAAEVFSEFRGRLDAADAKQDEILAALNTREKVILGGGDANSTPAAPSARPEIPADVLEAINTHQDAIQSELAKLSRQLDRVLHGIGRLSQQQTRIESGQRKTLIWVLSGLGLVILLVAGGIWIQHKFGAAKIAEELAEFNYDPDEISRKLRLEVETVHQSKIIAADKVESWRERERMKKSAADEREKMLENVDRLLEDIAEAFKRGEVNSIYRDMLRIIEEEGVSEALDFLESKTAAIDSRVGELVAQRNTMTEALRAELQPKLLGGELAAAAGDFDRAEALYRGVLTSDPSWNHARHRLWHFLSFFRLEEIDMNGDTVQALTTIQEMERLSAGLIEAEPDDPVALRSHAVSLTHAGNILQIRGSLPEALDRAVEGVALMRKAVELESSAYYRHDLSASLMRLADVASRLGDSELVRESSLECQSILESLVKDAPEAAHHRINLAEIERRLGDQQTELRAYDAAEIHFTRAVELTDDLVALEPEDRWRQTVRIRAHLDLAGLDETRGRLDQAHERATRLIASIRKLLDENPDDTRVRIPYCDALNILGSVELTRGNFEASLLHYQKLREVTEESVERDPDNIGWQTELCKCLNNLATLAQRTNNSKVAMEYYRQGIDVASEILTTVPKHTRALYFDNLSHLALGRLLEKAGEFDQAATHLQLSVQSAQTLYELNRDRPGGRIQLLDSLHFHGELSQRLKHWDAARESFEKYVEVKRHQLANDPGNTQLRSELIAALFRKGVLFKARKDYPSAIEDFETGLRMADEMAAGEPDGILHQINRAACLAKLGEIAYDTGDFDAAETYFSQTLAVRELQMEREPQNAAHRRLAALNHAKLANIETKGRDNKAAGLPHVRAAYELFASIAADGLEALELDEQNTEMLRKRVESLEEEIANTNP